jgi:hypothetical protein
MGSKIKDDMYFNIAVHAIGRNRFVDIHVGIWSPVPTCAAARGPIVSAT